jgi:fluoroquinolone transport system permease protein
MTRLISAMKTDVTVQIRNNLYGIGIGVAVLIAGLLSQLANPAELAVTIPVTMLLVVGGSTLLYVAGLIIFEKDEGTLNALIVSPLRTSEYLWSKIITLTTLATLEAVVMVGGAMLIMSRSSALTMPNIPILLLGIVAMGVLYTLTGIILIVRYQQITDFLVPVLVIALVLQAPFVHFMGIIEHPAFLIIPTSAPTMLIQGAFVQLTMWEWVYALTYTAALIIGLTIWAYRAFNTHIIMKVG